MGSLKKNIGRADFKCRDSNQDIILERSSRIDQKDANTNDGKIRERISDPEIKKNVFVTKRKVIKTSLIPKLKPNKNNAKAIQPKVQNEVTLKKLSRTPSVNSDTIHDNVKNTDSKEKSISKVQGQGQRRSVLKENETKESNVVPREESTRKMTSDISVLDKKHEALNDFEKSVKQISEIWLKTSTDLTNTLKNLKKKPSLDPTEFEVESNKIQMAIKQAKSLTLVKTRNVIAEAKKLMLAKEAIRTELENLLSEESLDLLRNEMNKNPAGVIANSTTRPKTVEGKRKKPELENMIVENSKSCEQPKSKLSKEKILEVNSDSSEKMEETESAKLTKKSQLIAHLKKKIFVLQSACEKQTLKHAQLQLRLDEFQEKFQWEHILWKQITKLKEQIKGLQHSNKHLETQKQELESKMTNLNLELNRLMQLNQVLNKRKFLLNSPEKSAEVSSIDSGIEEVKKKDDALSNRHLEDAEKVLAEKENVIVQLKKVLDMMKDQENLAQRQIKVFESKIKELQKI